MKAKYFEILTQRNKFETQEDDFINLQKSWKHYRIIFSKIKSI